MRLSAHIRRDDIVAVIAGRDASGRKTGKVLQVIPAKGRAIVEGINYVTKHLRKSQDNPKGSVVTKEAPIALANLLLYCPRCKKGVRIAKVQAESGKKARKCKGCGYLFNE